MKFNELIEKVGKRNAIIFAVVLCAVIAGICVFAFTQSGGTAGAGGQNGGAQGEGSPEAVTGDLTPGTTGVDANGEGYYVNEDGVPVYTIDPKKRAEEQAAEEAENGSKSITFPYVISDTGISVLNIDSYNGQYLEKGLDTELTGCAAMVVKNTGSKPLEFMYITAVCGDKAYTFQGSALEPGAMMVLQEDQQQAYTEGAVTSIKADVAEMESMEMSEKQVKVEETKDGALKVTNLTDKEIPCVRVFYKYYMSDENAYVGGITYNAKLTGLKAKGETVITPSHYEAGYSKVVMVRTYDSAE